MSYDDCKGQSSRRCGHSSAKSSARWGAGWRRRARPGLALLLLALALPAAAIVIRHDRADAGYVVDPARYPQFFHLHERNQRKVCLATLIAPRWAITAGHCVEDTPLRDTLLAGDHYALKVAGRTYLVEQLVLHPDYSNGKLLQGVDLALLRLDRDVDGVAPVLLQRHDDELDLIVTLVGWGSTGTGVTGRRHNDGKFRRAENRIDGVGEWLEFHFDDPRLPESRALALEGVPGLGDSGGPALLELETGPVLVGIAVGELARGDDEPRQGLYGATGIYERISRHAAWIDAVLDGGP